MKNTVSGMWRRVVLVRTGVSEELIASNFRVERISKKSQSREGLVASYC
jgi:hypothetical protein